MLLLWLVGRRITATASEVTFKTANTKMFCWNGRRGRHYYLTPHEESVGCSWGEHFGSNRKWIHFGVVESLVGKQHGKDRPCWRWLNDLVRSSLIQCQWRRETVSSSGLGQLLKEVTPDLVYMSKAPPHHCSDWLPPSPWLEATQRVLVEWSLPVYLTIVCIVLYHHRLQHRVHFTGFVMHMSMSHHRPFLSTR